MTLCLELKNLMNEYLKQHPNANINSLAMKSKVGASTLRRLQKDQIKSDPSPHTVLNLLSALKNEKDLGKLIRTSEGEIKNLLSESFGQFVNEEDICFDVDLNEALDDSTSYLIYKLCSHRSGTSKVKIGELYGKVGLDKLQKLIDLGFIEPKDDKLITHKKNFSLDIKTAIKHLPSLIEYYKPDDVAKGSNLFYSLSESINSEGIKKIKEVQKEAVKKIYEIMNSPFYEGDIPFFTIEMSDVLDSETDIGVWQ